MATNTKPKAAKKMKRMLDRPRYDQDNQPRIEAWFEPNGTLCIESTYKDGSKSVEVYGERTVANLRKMLGVAQPLPKVIKVGDVSYTRQGVAEVPLEPESTSARRSRYGPG